MTRSISEKIDRTVLFTYWLTASIKRPGLDIWKKYLSKTISAIFFSNSRSLERPVLIIETLEYCGARGHGLFLIPIHYGFLFYHFPTFKVFILPTLHQVVVVYIVVFVPSPLQPLQNLSRLSHGSCSREGSSIVRHFIQTGAFLRVLFPQLHIF